jgi:hypothetical protein
VVAADTRVLGFGEGEVCFELGYFGEEGGAAAFL